MPWSAKAQELLQAQYAAVGAAARGAFGGTLAALQTAAAHNDAVAPLLARYQMRAEHVSHYVDAYRRYCWEVNSLADLRLAPFHLLASEGAVHSHQNHRWHMETLAKLRQNAAAGAGCDAPSSLLYPTAYHFVDVDDADSVAAGVQWWEELTARGGEGMVVKPLDFVARGRRGLLQPALKVRGREYLRIIYGPEYTLPDQIARLRSRAVGAKRSLALREFALGLEALERFVQYEPLRRVHECVFGVLALESEPIDPRL
jgi:protein phosphatase